MAGKPNSDWACAEQCSYCFTIFVGVLFLIAGGAMAVYAGILMWSDYTIAALQGLEFLNTQTIQWAIFIVGLFIFCTSIIGMVSAGCSKCAATPEQSDSCNTCCSGFLSLIYIVILTILTLATLVVASFLAYYAVQVSDGTSENCPYSSDSNQQFTYGAANEPSLAQCSIDNLFWHTYVAGNGTSAIAASGWVDTQDVTLTCGYFCVDQADFFYCDASDSIFSAQTTGTYCTKSIPEDTTAFPLTAYEGNDSAGNSNAFKTGAISQMPYRPTLFNTLNTYLVPFLVVWWLIFVFEVLLIAAACTMCIRKHNKTKKEGKYAPSNSEV